MSNLIRWEPMGDLLSMRKEMDRLFDNFFSRPLTQVESLNTPMVDMYQTDTEVVVKAAIPGVAPEDLDIQVIGDVLTIRGEVKKEQEVKEATYHLREQRYSSFARSLALPAMVVADKADADIQDGMLTLRLPKAEEELPKAIKVKAK